MVDKRAIKVETLDRLAAGFQESRGITDKLTMKQMIAFAKEPVGGGNENKLNQLLKKTITEVTAEDLEGVSTIPEYIFKNNKQLEQIDLPNSVTNIGQYAFCQCENLSGFNIPENVKEIGQYAFYRCLKIRNVTIPDIITRIEVYTFYACYSITEIVIPNGVTYIGNSAFCSCENLSRVTIGNGVTMIDNSAFSACYRLSELTIPASVKSIGMYGLRIGGRVDSPTIRFLGTTPPTFGISVIGDYVTKIIVPKGCGDAYKSATNMSYYADRIEEATE